MTENKQSKTWIVIIVAILSMTCIIVVACIVFGSPFAKKLAEQAFDSVDPEGFELPFNGSFDSTNSEQGYSDGVTFVLGHSGQGALFDQEDSLYYLTSNNIETRQGKIEFWLKPFWDGNDNQTYVFFEIGDTWLNRFRITKDGANNFRFMVWSAKTEYDAACNVSGWVANEWHHVQVIWHVDNISLALDGELCDTQTNVVMPDKLSSRFYIGSSANSDLQAQAVIDEFLIKTQP
jgi:hypothetical protein